MVRLALVLAGTVASGQAWKKRRASGRSWTLSATIPKLARRPVGEGNPVRKERGGFHAQAWPTWRGAASSSVTAKGRWRVAAANPTMPAVALTAEEEAAELLAPVAVACRPWLTPIAASTSRDVLLRIQRELFVGKRGFMSIARFG